MYWDEARTFCENFSMDLLTFDSINESANILIALKKAGLTFNILTGGKRNTLGSGWIWAKTGKIIENGVLPFASGEPNNADGKENCLEIITLNSSFNDVRCEDQRRFACQKIVRN